MKKGILTTICLLGLVMSIKQIIAWDIDTQDTTTETQRISIEPTTILSEEKVRNEQAQTKAFDRVKQKAAPALSFMNIKNTEAKNLSWHDVQEKFETARKDTVRILSRNNTTLDDAGNLVYNQEATQLFEKVTSYVQEMQNVYEDQIKQLTQQIFSEKNAAQKQILQQELDAAQKQLAILNNDVAIIEQWHAHPQGILTPNMLTRMDQPFVSESAKKQVLSRVLSALKNDTQNLVLHKTAAHLQDLHDAAKTLSSSLSARQRNAIATQITQGIEQWHEIERSTQIKDPALAAQITIIINELEHIANSPALEKTLLGNLTNNLQKAANTIKT